MVCVGVWQKKEAVGRYSLKTIFVASISLQQHPELSAIFHLFHFAAEPDPPRLQHRLSSHPSLLDQRGVGMQTGFGQMSEQHPVNLCWSPLELNRVNLSWYLSTSCRLYYFYESFKPDLVQKSAPLKHHSWPPPVDWLTDWSVSMWFLQQMSQYVCCGLRQRNQKNKPLDPFLKYSVLNAIINIWGQF